MDLTQRRRPDPLQAALARLSRGRWGLLAGGALLFLCGAWLERDGTLSGALAGAIEGSQLQLRRWHALAVSRPERLMLDVEHEHVLKLLAKREEALRRNLLVTSPDDRVPAQIRFDGESLPVQIRLKGDLRDHWAGEKWSYRVVLKGDRTLFGMKQFSLQHPSTREYLWEWLYHEALRREDLPALRYRFVEVVMNGEDLGLYALEEHFEKRLIENNRLREGPIVRFDEDTSWLENARQGFLRFRDKRQLSGAGAFAATEVDAFKTNRWLEDPEAVDQYVRALELLGAFRDGTLTTSQVFDVEKLARFCAVTEILGAGHAAGWRNARFYYNPVTARLEPIGFDARGHGPAPIPALLCTVPAIYNPEKDDVYWYHFAYLDRFFADPAFFEAYVAAVERVAQPAWLRTLEEELAPEIERLTTLLHREFPTVSLELASIRENQSYARSVLAPPRSVRAELVAEAPTWVELEVANLQFLPVDVLALDLGDGARAKPRQALRLAGRDPKLPPAPQRLRLRLPEGWSEPLAGRADLRLNLRVPGATVGTSDPVDTQPTPRLEGSRPDATRKPPNAAGKPYLRLDEEARTLTFLPGRHTLAEDLILPAGYEVRCGPGTVLALEEHALILSRSPLRFIGSADHPIRVETSDGTGEGLVVLGAGGLSRLEHVRFEGLASPDRRGWQLTGAVTFYESPAQITSSSFARNRCEDGLNLIRSSFRIERCLFESTFSDAFDADWCDGELVDSSFIDCGNDGVDVSGSVVDLEGITVRGSLDKGISAGEASHVTGRRIAVSGAVVGLASKDLSTLSLEDAELTGCEYALATYQKKPEFGPGTLSVERLSAGGAPSLIEEGSRVRVAGEDWEPNHAGVYDALYGAADAP